MVQDGEKEQLPVSEMYIGENAELISFDEALSKVR